MKREPSLAALLVIAAGAVAMAAISIRPDLVRRLVGLGPLPLRTRLRVAVLRTVGL